MVTGYSADFWIMDESCIYNRFTTPSFAEFKEDVEKSVEFDVFQHIHDTGVTIHRFQHIEDVKYVNNYAHKTGLCLIYATRNEEKVRLALNLSTVRKIAENTYLCQSSAGNIRIIHLIK